jgi:hypothetical protein
MCLDRSRVHLQCRTYWWPSYHNALFMTIFYLCLIRQKNSGSFKTINRMEGNADCNTRKSLLCHSFFTVCLRILGMYILSFFIAIIPVLTGAFALWAFSILKMISALLHFLDSKYLQLILRHVLSGSAANVFLWDIMRAWVKISPYDPAETSRDRH